MYEENGVETSLSRQAAASMNFWGFTPQIFADSKQLFIDFALANKENPKAEFFIPLVAEKMIRVLDAVTDDVRTARGAAIVP